MITRLTSLSENVVQFCRFLRLKGFSAGVDEETLALQALQYIDYSGNKFFFLALKAVLCRTKKQADEFDDLFHSYWKQLEKTVNAKEKNERLSYEIWVMMIIDTRYCDTSARI